MEPVAYSNRPSFPASAPRRCTRALPHPQLPRTELRALSSRRAGFAVRTRYGLFSVRVQGRVEGWGGLPGGQGAAEKIDFRHKRG